jgi:hypothetical protein
MHDIPKPLILIVVGVSTPIPVEEIAVLTHLVLIGTYLSGSSIRGSYRDGEIEDGRLEDALLTDKRHPLTFEPELGQVRPRDWPLAVA